jgi:ribonuclease BN (tRNA processing enzyme)
MSDALFNEAYKIDIAARKTIKKGERGEVLPDISIRVTEVRDGDIAEGEGWRVRATEVTHWPIPVSLGFLVEGDGKRIFFTGDTSPCDAVRRDATGADLLIHEAMYFPPDTGHYRGHSHPKQVGEIARHAAVRHLALTHLQPRIEEERLLNDASSYFTQKITMATDRMRIVL